MNKNILYTALLSMALPIVIFAMPAFAESGAPVDWGLGLQEPATPVMARITEFHNLLLYIITGIVIFVFMLLFWIMIRYNSRANPKPATFAHNTMIEVIWTVVPIVILIVIAIPSMKLLYYSDRVEDPEMTVKAVGYQWYWGYEYPDHGELSFMSYMIPDDEINLEENQKRLLSTDNPLVLPVDTNIEIQVTAADVLHAFAIPAFGIKIDAVPGRLNDTWVRIEKPGVYYGQCSELCGKGHAYMPIEIHAVSKKEFAAWTREAKKRFVSYPEFKKRTELAKAEDL